jgi:hypothetical protein
VEREVWRSLEVISPTRTMLATRIPRVEEESGDDGVEEREGRPPELSAVEEARVAGAAGGRGWRLGRGRGWRLGRGRGWR